VLLLLLLLVTQLLMLLLGGYGKPAAGAVLLILLMLVLLAPALAQSSQPMARGHAPLMLRELRLEDGRPTSSSTHQHQQKH